MSALGDFLKSINKTKINLFDEDPLVEDEYVPFIINRTLGYFPDTVMYANEMNQYPSAPKNLQYDYLLQTIRTRNRFSRWLKKGRSSDLDMIQTYYGYSEQKAEQALKLLTPDQIQSIRNTTFKGGSNSHGIS